MIVTMIVITGLLGMLTPMLTRQNLRCHHYPPVRAYPDDADRAHSDQRSNYQMSLRSSFAPSLCYESKNRAHAHLEAAIWDIGCFDFRRVSFENSRPAISPTARRA